jgi:5'(3')-deoxyribonucleotidase
MSEIVSNDTPILCDLDGVLVDFMQGCLDVHGIKVSPEKLFENHLGKWDINKILEMPDAAFWKPMNEEFWAKLEWTVEGKEILRVLEDRFGQKNISIWTSPCDNYGCYDGKKRWVERHMPRHYKKTMIVANGKHRGARCDTILVDDADHNIDPFVAKGGHGCMVPRLWNRMHHRRHRVLDEIQENLDHAIKFMNECHTGCCLEER